eukprot:TRINITY_DN22371_c0_g1_i2.p1 TRINITY_DN22371_c0_g1~~TRINITY_DN22371_c0_g1_i2.p1  ORF type:complete len:134 (+),score=20.75 TRINITY_DN22371_c0_g1_i2:324-725(+)
MVGCEERVRCGVQEKKADLHACARDGSTPLIQAAAMGHKNVVRFFLETGVDVGQSGSVLGPNKTLLYPTALHAAAREGHHDIVELLIPQTSDPLLTLKDYQDNTAFEAARAQGYVRVMAILRAAAARRLNAKL